MLKNYFIIAFRNLLKHKTFSVINIFGLSVGIACCVLLALYIKDAFSYEKHFEGYENIYRITGTLTSPEGREDKMPRTSPPVAMTMLEEFPELESATRLVNPPEVEQHLLRFQDKTFYEDLGYLVDSTFFDVFSYTFTEGHRATALDAPSSVVLSEPVAKKIFGDQSALDQLLIINSGTSTDTFRVTGVLAPYQQKSQVDADFYMCMNSKGWGNYVQHETSWVGNNFVYAYIKLKEGSPVEALKEKFPALMDKHGAKQMKEMGIQKTLGLQALKDTRLYSIQEFTSASFSFLDLGGSGNILYVYILGSICIFILLIACINFMNLTTAKASQRAGEVGVRKALGANRGNLIKQFLGESMTIVLAAMILSIGMVQLTLPVFNVLTEKDLSITTANIGYIVAALSGVSLVTGILAGSYPAFFLSGFEPAKVLKDKRHLSNASNWLRKGLVVFQFVIAITLISSVVVIQKQLRFMQDKSLGFNPAHRVLLPLRTKEAATSYLNLKDRFKQIAGVNEVSGSSALPSTPTLRDLPLYPDGSNMQQAQVHLNINIDEDYFKLLDIELLAGRDLVFEKDSFNFGVDLHHILINHAGLQANGINLEEAVGSRLHIDWQGRHMSFQIEGVVDDFHQLSMHQKIQPMVFLLPANRTDFVTMAVSIEPSGYQNTLAKLEAAWKEINPHTPFESTLLTDSIKRQYENDQRIFSIITVFTVIAILISCLGLYGLSIYVAERKVKEIGIRKVLGASIGSIVGMLSRDFIMLIVIAFLISVPLGYYTMHQWLENFAYRTDLNIVVFILAGVASFSIAWITVGFQSVRAALGNPVESLRNE
ncbi:MAG TPA: ABC transporter permease [Ohtaekwangia sp.]|nr:ABC transporter permease [Ohtaekwangia sp.]